jgi:hypothetical protein
MPACLQVPVETHLAVPLPGVAVNMYVGLVAPPNVPFEITVIITLPVGAAAVCAPDTTTLVTKSDSLQPVTTGIVLQSPGVGAAPVASPPVPV